MPALSDLPELVGFFSYSRDDDEDSDNRELTQLRTRIQNELRGQLGRSRETLRLWQDQDAIAPGALWESQLEAAVKQAVFFIPIITPRVVFSKYCNLELERFLERERELGRNDLIFPILYIDVIELHNENVWRRHPVLRTIGMRQYVDWRDHRLDPNSVAVRRTIALFCSKVVASLRRQMSVPSAQEAEPKQDKPAPVEPTPPIVSEDTLLKTYDVEHLGTSQGAEKYATREDTEAHRKSGDEPADEAETTPEVQLEAAHFQPLPGPLIYATLAVFALSILRSLYYVSVLQGPISGELYLGWIVEAVVIATLVANAAGKYFRAELYIIIASFVLDTLFFLTTLSNIFSRAVVPLFFYLVLVLQLIRVACAATIAYRLVTRRRSSAAAMTK